MRFNGVIIGKGCVEVQYGTQMTGAIFVDGKSRAFEQPALLTNWPDHRFRAIIRA